MFYSQFILAKKGPLGTIWLAAHLERKLRKNEIADTDIAVSVDSILFPEVPIALRLSSHLLLGVVRIYSRKVNYLFHDCSEALLKIKQAFRSTVVDLPPEESIAPYHSITLPETFDLDGFELPDSAFQGNDVDHHVSTREQITLQDSVDDTGYTTLPFGLDERFGDGDSSQIHLDIDEGLFMGKIPSPQHASVQLSTEEGMVYEGQPSTSLTNMDIDERPNGCDEHDILEIPKDLSEVLSNNCDRHAFSSADNLKRSGDSQRHAYNIQTPDLNLVFFPDEHSDGPSAVQDYAVAADDALSPDLFDHAQAPSTPGLIEETIPANVQEIPALSPQEKTLSPTAVEVTNMENCVEFEGPSETNNGGLVIDEIMDPADNARTLSSLTLVLMEAKPVSLAPECSSGVLAAFDEASLDCGQNREDHLQSGFDIRTKPVTLASECLSGFLAEPDGSDEVHLECGHKCEEQLQSGFVCNEVSNLHDDMEAIHPQVDHLDGPVTSIRPLESSNLNIPFNQSTTDNIEAVTSNDNKCVPGKISEIESPPLSNKADPSILVNQEHAGDADCCLTNNTSALGSNLYSRLCKSSISLVDISSLEAGAVDPLLVGNHSHVENVSSGFSSNALVPNLDIHLRPCNLSLTQANMSSSEAGALGENAPVFSPGVSTCSFETPLIEQPLQGEDNHGTTNPDYEIDQKSETLLSKSDVSKPDDHLTSLSDVSKPDDQLTGLSPKESQLVNLNFCSNLGLPEPEKMLFAPNSDANPPNDFAQLTAEKVASESVRKVSRISSLSGNKRHLMDSSSVLQNSNSVKLSGLSRVKRKTPFMPDDDDLLASILVGRTPTLKMGLTPPPKVASRKRPRLTHRIGVPKRKVLLDDTVVLHAEEIRQQLINTEDIRRMRKKAPCTRPEIRMILKSSMEEEIFNESLLTGLSAELNSLHTRKYDTNENTGSQINEDYLDEHDVYIEPYKEMERSRMEEFVRENSGKETGEVTAVMLDGLDSGMQERSGTSISIEAQSCKEAFDVDAQEKLESHVSQLEPSTSSIRNVDERVGIELPLSFSTPSGNELEISTVSRIEDSIHKKCDSVILQEELLQDLVLADRTSNFTGTTVDDIASAEDATRCRVVDSTMQGPPDTSVLTKVQNCKGAVEFDVQDKLVPYIAQLEPSSDSQIISVSKGDVQERVGVETPLICVPHFGNERDILAAVSSMEEKFIHKKSEDIYVLQEQDLLHDLVQPSDKPLGMADRTSNFSGSAIQEAASAGDVTRCMTVDCVKLAATIENNLARAVGTSIAKDASISEEANRVDAVDLNSPQYSHDVGKIENGEVLVSMLDKCLLEDRAGLPTDSCSDREHANNHILDRATGIGESTDVATVSGCHAVDVAPMAERVLADEERPTSEILCSENPPFVSSFLHQLNTETENVPSAVGEKSVLHECTVEGNLDAESTPMDFGAARESSDFCNLIESNDTEFLNVDDEVDFDEAADDDMPDPETSLENSGWSTRTRGVARYLKTLFDDGYGRGKKIVTVDYLLTGKTRKEASRMFFETLVLKTRDYIHVEQEKPFDCLNIKPRPKLLKSEF